MTPPPSRFSRRAVILGGLATAAAAGVAACSGSKSHANVKGGTVATETAHSGAVSPTTAAPPPPTSSVPSGGPATFVARVPGTGRQVALTLHMNGNDSVIDAMLDVLAQHRTAVTAFVVGNWLDANRPYARRLQQGGHELANHTWSHPTFGSLGASSMDGEITECRSLLQELTGSGGQWFRPSGTDNGTDSPSAATLGAAGRAGYRTVVGYDVDPSDYKDPSAATIVTRTLQTVQPGSIVSLHFGHQNTVEAMPDLLAGLDRAGLRPVTLATLLGRR